MTHSHKIEILYFEDCPSWEMAQENLETALKKIHLEANIELMRVETDQEAKENHFVGSPSIRVNGEDLFPVDHENFALGCRIYPTPEGMRGWPTIEMLDEALSTKVN
jgi:hypothetical protein